MGAPTQKTYTFHVNGMHCNACVLMTESELKDVPYVADAKSSLKTHSVEVTGDFDDKAPEEIAEELTKALAKHGYSLTVEKTVKNIGWSDFKIAIPIALGFAIIFVMLQKIGLVNLVNTSDVSYSAAFLIGIIASLSSCMAVVGGLLLSMSATFAREADPGSAPSLHSADYGASKIKPQLLFHIGRIVSFFVLGGTIGAIGSSFQLGGTGTFVVSLIVGIVMLILGVNLLDVFHWTKKFQPSMPKFISKHALGISKMNHTLTPLLVGIATFFLPCGFTQSMQIYAFSTGSFLAGGLTMLFFALGTFPVLALISFSSFSVKSSSSAGIFFKTAGLIVIMFALFNLINSFVAIGAIPPVFNF